MNYTIKKISDLFSNIKIGGTPSRGNSSYFNGKNLWVSIRDMEGQNIISDTAEHITDEGALNSNCKLIKKGSLLFSFKLTVGKVAFAGADLYTNEAIAAFDIDEAELNGVDLNYLSLVLPLAAKSDGTKNSMGASLLSKDRIYDLKIPIPNTIIEQRIIANELLSKYFEIEKAKRAALSQIKELENLANAIIYESIKCRETTSLPLSEVLIEVKKGIGENWQKYPVYGATRNGLALAKEPPGKFPQRYKPVIPGTVFYNPMRILIGSIAFAEDDQADGITSPDYVVLKGKESVVDSRWFYYWLRSPLGKQCINSLARGAVRERMLFNRLAEGRIDLPDYAVQLKASAALASIKSMKAIVKLQMEEINTIPERLLVKAFEKDINV